MGSDGTLAMVGSQWEHQPPIHSRTLEPSTSPRPLPTRDRTPTPQLLAGLFLWVLEANLQGSLLTFRFSRLAQVWETLSPSCRPCLAGPDPTLTRGVSATQPGPLPHTTRPIATRPPERSQ